MAQVGIKAQGGKQMGEKKFIVRHGHAPPRAAQAAEKAIEVAVRQAGKKACQDWDRS